MEKKKKKMINKSMVLKILIVVILMITMALAPSINDYFKAKKFENKEREIVYCHFKTSINETSVKREECKNMKIVSKELNLINLTQFNDLKNSEFFCTENYDELPNCENENFYMSRYSLNLFTNTSIDGYMCISYQINFTTEDHSAIMMHLNVLMQEKFDNLTDQVKAFEECEFP